MEKYLPFTCGRPNYTDEVIHQIEQVFNVDLNKCYRKRGDIRKFIALMK